MFAEMHKALEHELYYLALQMALSVPDICSALEARPDDERLRFRRIPDRYKDWCARYVEKRFRNFTKEDCWALRGGVIHTGMAFGHKASQYHRIIFTIPHPQRIHLEGNTFSGPGAPKPVHQLEIPTFCNRVAEAAREWWEAKWRDPTVSANAPHLLRLRPNGLSPYIVGLPVIA